MRNRQIAVEWWDKLLFSEKQVYLTNYKQLSLNQLPQFITVNTITGRIIELIYVRQYNLYYCNKCLKYTLRMSDKKWINSECESTNEKSRLILQTLEKIQKRHLKDIGKEVTKTRTSKKGLKLNPRPFKSGNKTNTVKGIVISEYIGLPAYTFYEDESYVEIRRCSFV